MWAPPSVGPAVGGLLADAYGLRTPFLVVGAGALFTAVYGFLRLPETNRVDADEERPSAGEVGQARRDFVRSPQFIAVGLVTFAIFSIRSGFRQTLVPLVGVDQFGFDTGDLGLIFTGLGLVGLVLIGPAGWIADRFGRKPAIVPNGYIAVVGVLVTAFATTPVWFVVGLIVAAVGTGVSGPAPAAFVADITPPSLRGSAMGLYRTWGDLGLVLSPVLSGALADLTSIPTAMTANAIVLAAAVTWFMVVANEPRHDHGAS